MELQINSPINISEGDVVLAAIAFEYDGVNTLVLGTSGDSDIGQSVYQDVDGGEVNIAGEWYYTTPTPMLRLILGPDCSDFQNTYYINPNPLNSNCTNTISTIVNGGLSPYEFNLNGEPMNSYNFNIAGSNICDGINLSLIHI